MTFLRTGALVCAVVLAASSVPANLGAQSSAAVFINEIHYDNAGTDAGEFIEIAGPAGTDLSSYAIELYNGSNGALYDADAFTGTIPDQSSGFGTASIAYAVNGIQNGAPDGIALVLNGTVVQFLSYEGTFTATSGTAAGMTSVDIGRLEAGGEPEGLSLQLQGAGTLYEHFIWSTPMAHTSGAVNTGQAFAGDPPPPPPPPPPPVSPVLINEIDSDTPGSDSAEFIELYDGGAGATALDGLVVVLFNGSTDVVYAAFDLDGRTTDANGYFALGNAAVLGVGLEFPGNTLQNGPDAVALYAGSASDFPVGAAVTTAGLVDAIVYDTDDADDPGLLALLHAGQPQVDEDSRGTGADDSSQRCGNGAGGARNTATYRQLQPTPGGLNGCGGVVTARTIPEIQGGGLTTPFAGQRVSTEGIVTALKSNGFFLQTPGADSDPATSEAIFVFAGGAPTVVPGDAVRVTGTASEFFDLTQVATTAADVAVLSKDHDLPPAVTLTPAILDPDGTVAQLEPLEAMRVQAPSLTVVGATNFFGEIGTVLTGTPRPFREPGISQSLPLPAGAPATVPRFDDNPERLMIDSDALLGSTALPVSAGTVLTGVVGPLDFTFGDYKVAPEAPPALAGGVTPVPAGPAGADEFTVGSANLLNFSSTIFSFAVKLQKISLGIRDAMGSPDIIGVQEVVDLETLRALADRINADTVAAGGAFPGYQAILLEGTDEFAGEDIDVGFLVKTSRVSVTSVVQEGRDLRFLDPSDGTMDILFERPPLVLNAAVNTPGRAPFDVTVVVNHSQSLLDVELDTPRGERQRLKRKLQAEFTAALAQRLQDRNLVMVGDFNAFEFNDGYVDVIGTIIGAPAPASEVTLATEDVVHPNLTPLVNTLPPDARYSYVFEGSAQTLDHMLVDEQMLGHVDRFSYVRNNADFPQAAEVDTATTARFSDHDMALAYFRLPDPQADLSVVKTGPATATAGGAMTYNLAVTNDGPDDAVSVVLSDQLPAAMTFGAIAAPAGWACADASGAVTCTAAAMAIGATAQFEITATVACAADSTRVENTANVTSETADPAAGNDASSAAATIVNPAPIISGVAVDRPVIGPPNHRMIDVAVAYAVSDNCGPVTTRLEVASSEPANGPGDGDTASDWEVIDANHVRLRAERSGTGNGRAYTITVIATDATGGTSRAAVTVTVPK